MRDIIKGYSTTDTEREEFAMLTKKLIDTMVEFSLLTLRAIQNKIQAPLNQKQIEEAIDFDLQFRIQQINDPELLDIIRESAISEFLEEQKLTKNTCARARKA